jgi:DNA-binding protein YbaB
MLEDLITEAMTSATNKATSQMEAKMKSITGGISIPGLF